MTNINSNNAYEKFLVLQGDIPNAKTFIEDPLNNIDSNSDGALGGIEEFIDTSDDELNALHMKHTQAGSNEATVYDGIDFDPASKEDLNNMARNIKDQASKILGNDEGETWLNTVVNNFKESTNKILDGIKKANKYATQLLAQ